MEGKTSILFRCDGSHALGLGHVVRCLALAKVLRDHHACDVVFAMQTDSLELSLVEKHGFSVRYPTEGGDDRYQGWLDEVVNSVKPQVLVLDVRDNLPRTLVRHFREQGILIVTIDDPSHRRLEADLAFYPPVPQLNRLNWEGFTGKKYAGWKWVVLRDEFGNCPNRSPNPCPVLFVSMGGSDPKGLTLKVLEALNAFPDDECEVFVVLGLGFKHQESLKELIERSPRNFGIYENPPSFYEVMMRADLAICTFGVTAYELAAMQIPALYLCLSEDHAESASIFTDAGIGKSLGIAGNITSDSLSFQIGELLHDGSSRQAMSAGAKDLVDGLGAIRVAGLIMNAIKEKSHYGQALVAS